MSIKIEDQIGYCGIPCGYCAIGNGEIAKTAEKLTKFVEEYGFEQWIEDSTKDFKFSEFKKGLEWFFQCSCLGCKEGGGIPDCEVRNCAKEKNVEICSFCNEFPCELLSKFQEQMVPGIIEILTQIKEKGIDRWLSEQKSKQQQIP